MIDSLYLSVICNTHFELLTLVCDFISYTVLLGDFNFNRFSFIHAFLFIPVYCMQSFPTFPFTYISPTQKMSLRTSSNGELLGWRQKNREKDPLGLLRITEDLYLPLEAKSERICWLWLSLICFNTWFITGLLSHISETDARCFPCLLISPSTSDSASINSSISGRALFVQSDNKIYIFIHSI